MENWAYAELNRACRFKDKSKVPTLGPWAMALSEVINGAQINRTDVEKFDQWKQQDLWRGGGMTAKEIKQYSDMAGKKGEDDYINLFGYTSCSLDKGVAISFAWNNQKTGHSKVLFQIKWKQETAAYFLDAGAYDYEEEILIMDGTVLFVDSVEEIKNDDGLLLYTLITLRTTKAV